ncbi:hypothetical protein EAE99_005725 [Botrytis elliptica]|nr:hypothetical protein EAE99_005725 [Botrytis elliptica]
MDRKGEMRESVLIVSICCVERKDYSLICDGANDEDIRFTVHVISKPFNFPPLGTLLDEGNGDDCHVQV